MLANLAQLQTPGGGLQQNVAALAQGLQRARIAEWAKGLNLTKLAARNLLGRG